MSEITTPSSPAHRVGAAVAAVHAALGEVSDLPVWSMSRQDVTEALDALAAHEARSAALRSRLLVQAEAVEAPESLPVPAWLAHRTRLTRREAHRQVRLATGLDTHPLTAVAMAEGRVNAEQAEAILRGLDTLPADLDPGLLTKAEEHLLDLAVDFDAKALKNLSRRLLEVIAPEIAEAHEAKLLEKEEQDAAAAARFSMWEDGHGRVHGRFTLDALTGAMLTRHLLALAAPKHRASQGPLQERKPTPQRLGQAFTELVQRYPSAKLPKAGGLNATVVVLMPLETLLGGRKPAELDTGQVISASMARRLACEAGIIPAVLGGKSEVLDLGRTRRFHTRAQRIAATIEHRGCMEEGCDAPPGLTQMHHSTSWAQGGHTNVKDAWMLCPSAHRRAHDPRYTATRQPNGKIRFTRRT